VGHLKTLEPTGEYLERRNARMRNYSKKNRMSTLLREDSEEN